MSFNEQKTVIEEGDTVILYLGVNSLHAIDVKPMAKNKHNTLVDYVFQTNYGALKVGNLIGQKYGSRVELSKGWAYALHPTPELWTITLPHRTQIIYTPDISMILFQLELRAGCVVIESGTGSGSLSHALIRAIKPSGCLYTFDFHEQRSAVARAEFESHGVGNYVVVNHRDVCRDGFGSELNGKADAVFLDLPHPWDAVAHAVSALKPSGGRLCSFSPCVEQVQRTCDVLRNLGFLEVATMEVLIKEYFVAPRSLPVLNLDDLKGNPASVTKEAQRYVSGVPPPALAGHTGYLTVATLPSIWARNPPAPVPSASVNGSTTVSAVKQ